MRPDKLTSTAGITVALRYMENYHVQLIRDSRDVEQDDYPWQVDMLEAYIDDVPVGYLRTTYVTKERWDELYPTPLHWAARGIDSRHDHTDLLQELLVPQDQWTLSTYKSAIFHSYPRQHRSAEITDPIAELDLPAAKKAWTARKRFVAPQYKKAYESDRAQRCDKPSVEYIDVYSTDDTHRYQGGVTGLYDPPADWPAMRRKGIAIVMYQAAALWMAERGLNLHPDAPARQEVAAKMAWLKMDELFEIDEEILTDSAGNTRVRMFLDGSKLELPAPNLSALKRSPKASKAAHPAGLDITSSDISGR